MIDASMPKPVLNLTSPLKLHSAGGHTGSSDCSIFELQRLIEAFSIDGRFATSTVVVPTGSEAAAEKIASLGSCPTVIVAPDGMTDAMAALLAVQIKPEELRNSKLAVIPADLILEDAEGFVRVVHLACVHSRSKGKPVMFVRRSVSDSGRIAFESGGPDRWTNLLAVRNTGLANETDRFAVAIEMNHFYEANGPVVLSPSSLLEATRQSMAAMLSSCTSGMAVAERKCGVIYPNAGFLTLVKGQTLAQLLTHDPRKLLLHPGGELLRLREHVEPVEAVADAPVTAGVCAEVGIDCTRVWGSERLLSDDDGTNIIRMTVDAGKKVTRDPIIGVTIHWSIVGGTAFVKCGHELRTANSGEHFLISNGTKHSLTNIGQEDLIVYEIRLPMIADIEQAESNQA